MLYPMNYSEDSVSFEYDTWATSKTPSRKIHNKGTWESFVKMDPFSAKDTNYLKTRASLAKKTIHPKSHPIPTAKISEKLKHTTYSFPYQRYLPREPVKSKSFSAMGYERISSPSRDLIDAQSLDRELFGRDQYQDEKGYEPQDIRIFQIKNTDSDRHRYVQLMQEQSKNHSSSRGQYTNQPRKPATVGNDSTDHEGIVDEYPIVSVVSATLAGTLLIAYVSYLIYKLLIEALETHALGSQYFRIPPEDTDSDTGSHGPQNSALDSGIQPHTSSVEEILSVNGNIAESSIGPTVVILEDQMPNEEALLLLVHNHEEMNPDLERQSISDRVSAELSHVQPSQLQSSPGPTSCEVGLRRASPGMSSPKRKSKKRKGLLRLIPHFGKSRK
jgi:hypothetical protein